MFGSGGDIGTRGGALSRRFGHPLYNGWASAALPIGGVGRYVRATSSATAEPPPSSSARRIAVELLALLSQNFLYWSAVLANGGILWFAAAALAGGTLVMVRGVYLAFLEKALFSGLFVAVFGLLFFAAFVLVAVMLVAGG